MAANEYVDAITSHRIKFHCRVVTEVSCPPTSFAALVDALAKEETLKEAEQFFCKLVNQPTESSVIRDLGDEDRERIETLIEKVESIEDVTNVDSNVEF